MPDTSQVFLTLCDMNSLHGQMGFNLDYDTVEVHSGCTCPRYFSDKFHLEYIDLRHRPGPTFWGYEGAQRSRFNVETPNEVFTQ